ncbi:hypothetical protein [Marinobacterium rhizophilum]|uniref:Uncharacterized protein n=1 Tax=Marinobacterium rhizophilum TaxID=420402 RepID=A0ABY5HMC5_9GAMM|nr:hypothetical protein [Marinobacterium rhizophilum]UTW12066.1 hypothetical protein KDW95_23055 [Marinobacterium rhizophilum]
MRWNFIKYDSLPRVIKIQLEDTIYLPVGLVQHQAGFIGSNGQFKGYFHDNDPTHLAAASNPANNTATWISHPGRDPAVADLPPLAQALKTERSHWSLAIASTRTTSYALNLIGMSPGE